MGQISISLMLFADNRKMMPMPTQNSPVTESQRGFWWLRAELGGGQVLLLQGSVCSLEGQDWDGLFILVLQVTEIPFRGF